MTGENGGICWTDTGLRGASGGGQGGGGWMPGQFLTEAERARLRRFPEEIPPADVIAYFTLSPADLVQVRHQRGDHNRLGFALQLGALRYLGFSPDDLTTAPASVVAYLSQQLDIRRDVLPAYGQRAHTRRFRQQGMLGLLPDDVEVVHQKGIVNLLPSPVQCDILRS
jgi:Domain of unknown function (DUF4158)